MAIAETDIAPSTGQQADRRHRILNAAEHCIVRTGFHKMTMQDIAAECGMSPGNLYRYFPSKDAIVAGLAERDRTEFESDFARLETAEDPLSVFVGLGRSHLVNMPRNKAVVMQEIWAEATRNSRVAAICGSMDASIHAKMSAFIARWRAQDGLVGHGSPEDVARMMIAMGDGLCRRRATEPAFDPTSSFTLMVPVVLGLIGVDATRFPEVM